jgi:hypothetical protein
LGRMVHRLIDTSFADVGKLGSGGRKSITHGLFICLDCTPSRTHLATDHLIVGVIISYLVIKRDAWAVKSVFWLCTSING